MPISFACGCGKTLRVADEHAGKRVKCPACQGVAVVPLVADDAGFEVVDDAPPPPARPAVAKALPAKPAQPAPPPPPDDGFEVVDDDEPAYQVKRGQTAKRIGEEDDDAPRPRTKRKRDQYDDEDEYDRAERRRAMADPYSMRRGRKPDNTKRMMFLFGGLLALVIGCGMLWYYWDSDEQVRGRRGRMRSMFSTAVAVTITGVVCTGMGATGLGTGGDDDE